jgi:SAM-dependent methyltransferase
MPIECDSQKTTCDNDLLRAYLPGDHSAQTFGMKEALTVLKNSSGAGQTIKILDLGCGTGASYDEFARAVAKFSWVGIDIEDSPEVQMRVRNDVDFMTFDGVVIPLPDASVDLVYSHQVYEHVRKPEDLLAEIIRVLRPGGYFIGSTSHLEPFHSRSFWNFTPYGFASMLQTAGFTSILLRPGIDGLTLIIRRLLGLVKLGNVLNPFFKHESPLNLSIELLGRFTFRDIRKRNALKLLFSGHFIFIVSK